MTHIDKVCRSLLPALLVAALASCGSRSREPQQPAGPSAAYQPAAVPDLSPPKGDGAGSLPSVVVSGEVAPFKAGAADATTQENRDAAGSLPSNVAAGKSAAYVPEGGREQAASGTPPARMAKP